MRNGIENTNLEKIVMIKSTSPLKDFMIIWVDNDNSIKKIQIMVPIILEDMKISRKNYVELVNNTCLII